MNKYILALKFALLSIIAINGKTKFEFESLDFQGKILSSQIFCFYQDHEGFIWIGTANGLYRYDGTNYEQFFHVRGDTTSISNNDIKAIGEDGEGNLWIGTVNGLNLYDRVSKKFKWFFPDELDPSSISSGKISVFELTPDGTFYIGTSEGLNKLIVDEQKNISFQSYIPGRRNNFTKSELSILDIYGAPDHSIWVGTWGGGILHFNPGKGEFTSYLPPVEAKSLNDYAITNIEKANDSMVYVSSYSGNIFIFDIYNKQYYVFANSNPLGKLKYQHLSIYSLEKDRNGKLWIGTSNKLFIYDPQTERMLHEGTPLNEPFPGKVKDNTNFVYQDKEGLIWIGYSNNGIDIYDPRPNQLEKFHYTLNSSNTYRDYVKNIVIDNKLNYWISTWGDGLLKVNKAGEVKKRIFLSDYTSFSGSDIITDTEIDVRGNLWIGTQFGLLSFDPGKEKITRVFLHDPNDSTSLSDNHIYRIFPDEDGFFWILSQESFRLLDPIHGQLKRVPFLENLSLVKMNCVIRDFDDNYWLGTFNKGVYFYNTKENSFTNYQSDPHNSNSLCSNEIRWLFEDSNRDLWIATTNGVCMFDKSEGEFRNFPDLPELSHKTFTNIYEDKNGNIWLLGYTDLNIYNPRDNSLVIFDSEDGLSALADNFSWDREGNIILTDEKGFYRIDPDSISKNEYLSPIYITNLFIAGKRVEVDQDPLKGVSIMHKNKITLKHNDNNFGFSFVAINFARSSKAQYEYKLVGYNEKWIRNGAKSEVTFMNLPPGKYTFLTRTQSKKDEIASIEINLLPPPWRTNWAYAFYIMLITSIIFAYRKYTIIKERKNSIQVLDKMKLSFFINISHELRTPLTLVTGPLDRLLKKEKNIEHREKLKVVYRNASRMEQLINQILDIRKMDIGTQYPVACYTDFTNFMDSFLHSFKNYADDNRISLQISSFLGDSMMWFDPEMIEKAFSNILINAFKYSKPNDRVKIIVRDFSGNDIDATFWRYKNEMHLIKTDHNIKKTYIGKRFLSVEFIDQGPGIPKEQVGKIFERFYQQKAGHVKTIPGSGIGLSFTRELIELMKGYIFVESIPGENTKFVLYFPVSRDAYHHITDQSPTNIHEHHAFDYSKILINSSTISKDIKKHDEGTNEEKNKTRKKPSILAVDDNIELLDYMLDILNNEFNVSIQTDGESAYKIAIGGEFDLIISDIMMPVMDGLEFCRKIKQDINTCHIPIILLTAKTSLENELEGLDSGADDYINKPFNEEILIKRVRNAIINREKIWKKMASDTEIIPEGLKLTTRDEEFLKQAVTIVEKYLSTPDFNQDLFSKEIGLSKASLYRKINGLTNFSINEFVRNIRLKKAAEILRCGKQIHIGELTYQVGFSEPSYFTKKFRELFGVTPKVYNNKYINKVINIEKSNNE